MRIVVQGVKMWNWFALCVGNVFLLPLFGLNSVIRTFVHENAFISGNLRAKGGREIVNGIASKENVKCVVKNIMLICTE